MNDPIVTCLQILAKRGKAVREAGKEPSPPVANDPPLNATTHSPTKPNSPK